MSTLQRLLPRWLHPPAVKRGGSKHGQLSAALRCAHYAGCTHNARGQQARFDEAEQVPMAVGAGRGTLERGAGYEQDLSSWQLTVMSSMPSQW